MTVAAVTLGAPRPAESRGGDCRARDLARGLDVYGPHRFAEAVDCQFSNGMLRLTVGAEGAVPTLTVEAWRGRVTVDDLLVDVLSDALGGAVSTPEWLAMGSIVIDSPSVAGVLTGVRLAFVNPEAVTVRFIAPALGDAYVTLERGERMVRVQHGTGPLSVPRRVRWTPAPTGTTSPGRVQEWPPAHHGFPRFVASIDPVATDAAGFAVATTAMETARVVAGVATYAPGDTVASQHAQVGDASLPLLVVETDESLAEDDLPLVVVP